MKCPLLVMGQIAHQGVMIPSENDCFKGECAWYYDTANGCVLLRLNTNLGLLASSLRDIASKTPLGGKR